MPATTAPTLVTPHVLLGGREDAACLERLRALGITHVLNVSLDVPHYHHRCGHLIYLRVPVRDEPTFRLAELLPAALAFLRRCSEIGGRCLVHCRTGDGPAAAVVTAFLHAPPPQPPPKPHPQPLWPARQGRQGPHTVAAALLLLLQLRPSVRLNEGHMMDLALAEIDSRGGASSLRACQRTASCVAAQGDTAARKAARRSMTERARAEDTLAELLDFADMAEELDECEDIGRSRFMSFKLSRKVQKRKKQGSSEAAYAPGVVVKAKGRMKEKGSPHAQGAWRGAWAVLRRLFAARRRNDEQALQE